uniref:Secreted protein n=1 Tax=Parascaris univalens TaxID=6257 RepID=A0A915AUF9_PARUN
MSSDKMKYADFRTNIYEEGSITPTRHIEHIFPIRSLVVCTMQANFAAQQCDRKCPRIVLKFMGQPGAVQSGYQTIWIITLNFVSLIPAVSGRLRCIQIFIPRMSF